jgi:glutathione S-transferase
MAEFTLDCFLESGNAYKAALMLELSGADWAPRRSRSSPGRHVRRNSANLNVMGEVPVLTITRLTVTWC